jgi:hypothetical protein
VFYELFVKFYTNLFYTRDFDILVDINHCCYSDWSLGSLYKFFIVFFVWKAIFTLESVSNLLIVLTSNENK